MTASPPPSAPTGAPQRPAPASDRRVVVFDLGGVLIDWDPRHLYRQLLPDEAAVEAFLATVCTQEWNELQDFGRPFAEAVRQLQAEHPEQSALIAAYHERWPEMIRGAIEPTVALLERLDRRGVPLYALTNWSHETFHVARERFPFLGRFRDIVVSGEEKVGKPDPRIFEILFRRGGFAAADAVFIDDSPRNVEAARRLGIHGILFRDADRTAAELERLGLL